MLKSLFTDELLDAALGRLPEGKRKDRPKTISVFKNHFLEHYLARAHWTTPGIWFFPIAAYCLYRSAMDPLMKPLLVTGLFMGGWLFWSLVEYMLHRFFFHVVKPTEAHPENYLAHGYHHDFPDDPWRLVMVPMGSWPLGVFFAILFRVVLGQHYWFAGFAGAACGYVAYDWVHYYTHHARPKGGIGKWLRMYHLQHHHDARPGRYGVSMPLWDFVFGTYLPIKSAQSPSNPSADSA